MSLAIYEITSIIQIILKENSSIFKILFIYSLLKDIMQEIYIYNLYDIHIELRFFDSIQKIVSSGMQTYDLVLTMNTVLPLNSLTERRDMLNCLKDKVTTRLKSSLGDCGCRVPITRVVCEPTTSCLLCIRSNH